MHGDHAQHRGQYVHVSHFLSWCGGFTVFDLVFLFVGVFFKLIRVRSMYCFCWASVSCNCYLLGWGNMCEIIAIWRRILELISRFSFWWDRSFFFIAGALWGSVQKNFLLCFFVKRCFIIYRWYSSYRKLMQLRLAGGDVRTGCSVSSCCLVVLLTSCLFDWYFQFMGSAFRGATEVF